jgi:tripartite ATP-independent transporter DctM subunit
MDMVTMGLIAMAAITVLLLIKMPIGLALLLTGFIGLSVIRGLNPGLDMIGSRPFDINSSYDLAVVPLFILMGHLTFVAGITQDLYFAARQWVGHLKGGLVIATTLANAAFGACCGSTTAATAVFGKVAIPEMLRQGVNRSLAAGCVAASGSLSAMIPPSILLVVYGILAQTSVPKLLIAGFIPGILQATLFSLMVFVRASINPKLAPPVARVPWKERFGSLKGGVWGVVFLFMLVMGGIWGGLFTPTEGGAIGAIGAFILVLATKKFSRSLLNESFLETARTTSVIFIIVTGAMVFSMFLSLSGVPTRVSQLIVTMPVPPLVIVLGTMLILIALGCVVDVFSMMFLTMPIFLPVMRALDLNLVWYGILVVTTTEMGQVTPPFGLNCFMLKSVVPELSLGEIFRGVGWYVAMFFVSIILVMFFPQIALFLPNTMSR